jgi:starch-binding outer membrane protein, SusD/RagB family
MKHNKVPYIIALAAGAMLTYGCSKSFLEAQPKGTDLENSYYGDATEAMNGLTAIYDVVGYQASDFVTKIGTFDAASDDQLAGGGGANDVTALQVMSNYTLTPATGPQGDLWKEFYSGVYRANVLLGKLPNINMDAGQKARFIAEAKALRAYFNFDLVRIFKNVPLLLRPVTTDSIYLITQAAPADVYAQVEADLKDAIAETNLPDQVNVSTDGGRLTKGAVHALLGKVYLYEQKWADAAAELAIVNGTTPGQTNATYGYKLLDNYADLWTSVNTQKFNSESIMEIAFTSTSAGTWDCISCTEGNLLNIMTGPRNYVAKTSAAPGYYSGYSFLVVTPDLYNAIHFDPRYHATIANLDSLQSSGIASYSPGYNNTGYFLNKFIGYTANQTKGGGNVELNFPQNEYEIRLADTYLMEAEALIKSGQPGTAGSRAYDLLNAVRARVGLPAIPATDDNIFNERRLELAGEGHRWFDLVRTGRAATVLASKGFVAGKNEILPIPLTELTNTKLQQSKEWGGTK